MQNKSRPNSRKILVQASHTSRVLGSAKCVGRRRRVGAYLPKWVPRTEIVQPTVPQKRQLTHALPQVRWGPLLRATSINCLQLQSSPLFTEYQSPRLCFYEHSQSLVTLYLLMEFFTCCAQNCQTVFANIFIQGSLRKKKTWRLSQNSEYFFRCCGESLHNRTNMIMVEITQKHVSALYPVSLKTPHIRAFKIVFLPHPNLKILFNLSFGNIFPQVRPCIFYDKTFQTY